MSDLKDLYIQMAALTLPECKNNCRRQLSCCSMEYCQMAKQFAKEEYNIDLQETNNPKLLYMTEGGCTVPPYLRPHCTLHTCAINSLGLKPGDPKWTEKYFKLREQIDQLEFERMEKK